MPKIAATLSIVVALALSCLWQDVRTGALCELAGTTPEELLGAARAACFTMLVMQRSILVERFEAITEEPLGESDQIARQTRRAIDIGITLML